MLLDVFWLNPNSVLWPQSEELEYSTTLHVIKREAQDEFTK